MEWFILVGDNGKIDWYDYVIPKDKVPEWEEWLDTQDSAVSDVPAYARRVDGDLVFREWKIQKN